MSRLYDALRKITIEHLSWFGAGLGVAGVALVAMQLFGTLVDQPTAGLPRVEVVQAASESKPTRTPFASATPWPTRTRWRPPLPGQLDRRATHPRHVRRPRRGPPVPRGRPPPRVIRPRPGRRARRSLSASRRFHLNSLPMWTPSRTGSPTWPPHYRVRRCGLRAAPRGAFFVRCPREPAMRLILVCAAMLTGLLVADSRRCTRRHSLAFSGSA